MSRLTKIIKNAGRTVICLQVSKRGTVTVWKEWDQCPDHFIKDALFRLAAYENTGLTPEEIYVLLHSDT